MVKILKKLQKIQTSLNVKKDRYNKFGGFYYRSLEDIVEGLRPLLDEYQLALLIQDSIVIMEDRIYVKATATLYDVESGEKIESEAFAREPNHKLKMDDAQVTGASSSYARKYCLQGMFLLDDSTLDPDRDQENNYKQDVREMILEMCGGDVQNAQNILASYTNKRSVDLIPNQQIPKVYQKIKKDYDQWKKGEKNV